MSQQDILDILGEYRLKENGGYKIFVSLEVLEKKAKVNRGTVITNVLRLEKQGLIEAVEVAVLPRMKSTKGTKEIRIKAVRLKDFK